MHQLGVISDELFATFEDNGGEFPGQPSRSDSNHVDYSGGSLGMGLSYGVGIAKCFREDKEGKDSRKAYVIQGDGECNEGAVWEAAGLASKWQLGNLCVVVDCNGLQSDGKCDEIIGQNLEDIWTSFGWNVQEVDGHDVSELKAALCKAKELPYTPSVILAKTIKGCGVSFMENNNEWHHSELTDENFSKAIEEIGGRYGI